MPSIEHPPEAEPMGIEECVQEGDALGGMDIHSLVCLISCVILCILFDLSIFQPHVHTVECATYPNYIVKYFFSN